MKLSSLFAAISLCLLLAFALLSLMIDRGGLRTTDFNLTVRLQDNFPVRLDDNLAVLVDLASMEIQALVLAVTLLILPLSKREKLTLGLLYGIGLAVVLLGKQLLHHPAPPFLFQRAAAGLPFPTMHVQVEYSYPSGHTYRAVFLTVVLLAAGIRQRRPLLVGGGLLALLLTGLIMVGLIVLGKHWTTDVLGSIALAGGLALLPFYFFATSSRRRDDPRA